MPKPKTTIEKVVDKTIKTQSVDSASTVTSPTGEISTPWGTILTPAPKTETWVWELPSDTPTVMDVEWNVIETIWDAQKAESDVLSKSKDLLKETEKTQEALETDIVKQQEETKKFAEDTEKRATDFAKEQEICCRYHRDLSR